MRLPLRIRRNVRGISPVIAELLMVSITVVLAVTVWYFVTQMTKDPSEDTIVVNLDTPDVQRYTRDSTTVWDATIEVNRLSSKSKQVVWTQVGVIVKDATGSLLDSSTSMSDDATAIYDIVAPIAVEFWYVDTAAGDVNINAGDSIKITGMDVTYEGATIELVRAGELIGSITLPGEFY
jgi:flagellin-like protein